MKTIKSFTIILLASLGVISCAPTESGLRIDTSQIKPTYTAGATVSLAITNPNQLSIDSVAYTFNQKRIGSTQGNTPLRYTISEKKLGTYPLVAAIYAEGNTTQDTTSLEIVSAITPKIIKYKVVNTFPHDISSYTQGLEFHQGILYEGTGQYGQSKLMKTDYKTGKVLLSTPLDAKYFGEGITIFNNKVYQLTWQEQTGFIYDAQTLEKTKSFSYDRAIEGWGLTHDATHLYQSDGTEKIYRLDPESLKVIDVISVYSSDSKVKNLNELEWVNGKIYSNVYQQNAIVRIDPATGAIEAILDLSDLLKQITQLPETDVLNGIAFNPATQTFFITGKKWDKMFEIKIVE